jgi:hypothetical protein
MASPGFGPPGGAPASGRQPYATQPDNATQPNTTQPNTTQSGATLPGSTQAGVTRSGTTQVGAARPGTAQPAPPADTATPSTYTPAPPVEATWQPQGTAVLQLLDKIDAQSATLDIKAGQSAQYGALTIAVRACDVSRPDEKVDATAFLDITDSHPDLPSFHGWILKSDPSVSMLQHPIYDVRVLGCRP